MGMACLVVGMACLWWKRLDKQLSNHNPTIHGYKNNQRTAAVNRIGPCLIELFSFAYIALLAVFGGGWATIRVAIHEKSRSEAGSFTPVWACEQRI